MRMSASSSTIRMSCAMGDCTQVHPRRLTVADNAVSFGNEYQLYPGSGRLRILEQQPALVIFHDLLDDGEAQAGALRPCRHIGFGETLAAALGQSFAIILDGDL